MADSIVVADNVQILGQNIQSKVGQTLLGATAVANKSKVESGADGPLGVLDTIAALQQKTIDKITKVWETIQAGVKFEKNEARLVRQERKETELEKKKEGGDEWFDSVFKGELPGESGVSTFLGGFLAGKWGKLLTIGGLMMFLKGIFKRSLLAILGGYVGSLIIDGLVKDQATKNQMSTYLTVGLGLAMFGKKGIAAGLLLFATMGITSLYEWMSGQKQASEFSGFQWGHIALTGPALMMVARVGGLLGAGGLKLGAGTLGVLLGGWPFIIAASLAIALAAGIGYVAGEMEKYRTTVLDHLHKITSKSQQEFNENMANEEEKFGSKIAPNLAGAIMGDDYLTDQQKLKVGMEKAQELAEGKGPLESDVAKTVVDATAQMADQTLDPEKFNVMMADEYKMGVMLQTIAHIMKIISTEKLAPDDEKIARANIQRLLDHIEASAKEKIKSNKAKGIEPQEYMVHLAQDDKIEKEATLAPKIELLKSLLTQQKAQLAWMRSEIEPVMTDSPVGPINLGITEGEMEADAFEKKFNENKRKLYEMEQEYKYGKIMPFREFSVVNTALSAIDMSLYKAREENKLNSLKDIKNVYKADRSLTAVGNELAGSVNLNNNNTTGIDNSATANSVVLWSDGAKVDGPDFTNSLADK